MAKNEILRPDICVIGAGSGGLSVAAAAAAFGVSVVLVERGKMGGDCLNYGCVPSKSLIAAGKHAHSIAAGADFGVFADQMQINFGKIHQHIHDVIAAIEPNDSVERFTGLGVQVIQAEAQFVDRRTVAAGEVRIRARRFVIATGSAPTVPPIEGLQKVPYFTNETVFGNTRRIGHLIIVGAGPIGLEMAQAFRRLGSDVTVLEAQEALAKEDRELAEVVLRRLADEGVNVITGARVARFEEQNGASLRAVYDDKEARRSVEGTHLLIATGRRPNVKDLNLKAAGIRYSDNGIEVNKRLKTSNGRVFAIGDVIGGMQFTHLANYHAGLVIRAILFRLSAKEDPGIVPRVTFTDPEIAGVGLSEEEAARQHGTIRVLRWPYAENDRAQAERRTEGFIKAITDKRGRILGAAIVGAQAGELIQMWALAITQRLNIKAFTGIVSPYPTYSEISKRAAITYFTPSLTNPNLRRLLAFLRKFG